jgi:tetratricopeptide (TPR) repeat protein
MGLGIPALVMLGMLWPVLKARERFVFVALVAMVAAAPLAPTLMGRLALPLREDGAPFHDALTLENAADPAAVEASLAGVALSEPDNGFAQFALAWNARRAGDLAAAEASYRRALRAWPNNDRALNNLGNLLAMQGRFTEALQQYEKAAAEAPRNAAPHFNASQVHTRLFEYGEASDEVARASALDFELVRAYQARTGDDLPLIDQWIAPATFWNALAQVPADAVPAALPPAWSGMVETSGWPYAGLALGLALLGLGLGLWWQKRMPLRACSNCARPVCRRCAHRQREQALCSRCAAIAARAESPEFGRVLLGQQRRRVERIRGAVRTAFVALIPGVGLVAGRRIITTVTLLVGIACLVQPWLGARSPFALGTGLEVAFETPGWMVAASWLLVYVFSILGFLTRPAETEPEASRAGSSNRASLPFAEPPARAA